MGVKVAALQLSSGHEVAANLDAIEGLTREAVDAGAQLVALPENCAFLGLKDTDKLAIAEEPGAGPIQERLAGLARSLGVWLVAGTIALKLAGTPRVAAACLVYDAQGRLAGRYDKIHLFDVDIPERGEIYRESANIAPGKSPIVVEIPFGKLGLSVCYDVRFPELYRQLAAQGAQVLLVPSAFTVPTGRAHWEVLLRARAIENLCCLVAPAQWGVHSNGRETFGDTMIVDHWGRVLARRPTGPGWVLAELDLDAQARARRDFPALGHRRLPG
ncbi:MAG TPA: carbon-nitrogen hydrolase family protein [Steroidobacteraceae bacterium]|nr:carbon-nitrogen hydrolase family protein [Steroidobacteraceae bacterium]